MSGFSFRYCTNTNNPDEKTQSAIKMCNWRLGGNCHQLVSIRSAVIMLPSRVTAQSILIKYLNILLRGVHWILMIGVNFVLPSESRGKNTAILHKLEKGCSLVFSDGIILGNAGVVFCVLQHAIIAQIWFRLIWLSKAGTIWWREFQRIYLLSLCDILLFLLGFFHLHDCNPPLDD